MERKRAFTPATIDALKDGKHADPSIAGLSIEVRSGGKKIWQFRRRIAGDGGIVKLTLGQFPTFTIAAARIWATELNEQVEAGIDPRAVEAAANERAKMTIEFAHSLYGSGSRRTRITGEARK